MQYTTLDKHLQTLRTVMTNSLTSQYTGTNLETSRKNLTDSRTAVKQAISGAMLNGAKIDRDSIDVFSQKFKANKKTKAIAMALDTVPGLELDHTYLIRAFGKIIGLITMPYRHQLYFIENGSNDRAIWSTHDELSWHFPGETRLTIVLDKTAMKL